MEFVLIPLLFIWTIIWCQAVALLIEYNLDVIATQPT